MFAALPLMIGMDVTEAYAAENTKPNFVVIISDDQAYHDFGFMGHKEIQTPHLDRLAEQSLVFTRGYVTTALCAPSLATMLTGQYPHTHGWTGNDPAKEIGGWAKRGKWIAKFGQSPQLPALMAEAGYLSLHTGKYYAMVDWLDETCGDLLGHLDEKGLSDNTVVLFICDNGWPHGDSGYRGHVGKQTPWEQGVRAPIMIRWPGKVEAAREEIRLASNVDLPVKHAPESNRTRLGLARGSVDVKCDLTEPAMDVMDWEVLQ